MMPVSCATAPPVAKPDSAMAATISLERFDISTSAWVNGSGNSPADARRACVDRYAPTALLASDARLAPLDHQPYHYLRAGVLPAREPEARWIVPRSPTAMTHSGG